MIDEHNKECSWWVIYMSGTEITLGSDILPPPATALAFAGRVLLSEKSKLTNMSEFIN